jgi:hypothetical protein
VPAIHCPCCDALHIDLHCKRDHSGAIEPAQTCDLLICLDCGTIWCPRHREWQSAPKVDKESV